MLIENGTVKWNKDIERAMLLELAKTCTRHEEGASCYYCQVRLTAALCRSLEKNR